MTFQLCARDTRRKNTTPRLSQSSRATTRGASPSKPSAVATPTERPSPTRRRAPVIRASRTPEQSLGTRHQDTEEEQQPDHLAVGPPEDRGAERLRAPEDHTAHEGSERGPEPREHDHDQRLEGPLEADGRADRVAQAHEGARRARQRRADGEREPVGAANVDSE